MKRVLIANRGEIASRIIKTCKERGVETIAVYSDADAELPFVSAADKAFRIGEPPVAKSYLNRDKLIEIAISEGADAVHPGYGLLSENAEFAKKVEEAGIKFIGPDWRIVEKMGDKILARKTMLEAGVPVVPGTIDPVADVGEAVNIASSIGYPVMLKASGGGGGIGMIKCDNEEMLQQHFASSQQRALSYFGNGAMFIEKYIENARHIEVQIFGDVHGNIVHLYERDCSVQRRNQKVIEETPSPFLTTELRNQITEAAVLAAKAVNYTNAGTVEFVVSENGEFYFLEMNTRLQVEHPVTEMITGIDLVAWQLDVADGKPLSLVQEEITSTGHSMEFRLYAEDPVTFMPSPGKIASFNWTNNDKVRIDSGYKEGNAVTPFYDPMIAKIIVSDCNRESVIQEASKFFEKLNIEGLKTNAPLFQRILNDGNFREGKYTTAFLAKQLTKQ